MCSAITTPAFLNDAARKRDASRVRFGIVLLPNFTLTAFSGFVDLLRLASDDGDFSKPVRCAWTIVGETLTPIRASCGIQIQPWQTFDEAGQFDYIVVIGGLLHAGPNVSDATLRFIRDAAAASATLVGICTGAFALTRAGVMNGYRICVSWFHYWDYVGRFPSVDETLLVADRLYVIDGRRITCSGGRASIDVAAAILQRHIDAAIVQKALRILLVEDAQRASAPQPHPPGTEPFTHPRVKRAVHLMQQHIGRPLSLDELAERVDMSARHLQRLFKSQTGDSPLTYARRMRLKTAAWFLTSSERTVAEIAATCGFSDASHLGREFRKEFGLAPNTYRANQMREFS
ncbi:GlxA family transcriptional regulator [Burkholderia sp. Ac-20365]|jgi:transcriptional regulator GlxA family with amidase domain|uniref:GlxA family transcriptional regulator n=1 Tax=Burkholderia sp. Ac-20365 TaxID=2703897 RepID=UPI00197C4C89|nr:GlxA family transcriptional regulator [Burkholderia sp. Ac-20365]MBN3764029.1 GlxA family transcriptional regulator [Burkholderia sp. Ac-20365]